MRLTTRQTQRMQKLRRTPNGILSYDQLKIAISAPFTQQTLIHAMRGGEIRPSTYHFLISVLNRHAPENAETDGKSRAAGADSGQEPPETAVEPSETPETGEAASEAPIAKSTKRGSR